MRIATDPYIAWYTDLPSELKNEIEYFISFMLPNHPLDGDVLSDDLSVKFVSWIRQSSDGKFKAVGTALALVKLIEFVFINQRGTHEDWDITWNQIESMHEALKNDGNADFAKKVENQLLQIPDRSATWIASVEAWCKLRLSTLSDDALHSCLRPGAA